MARHSAGDRERIKERMGDLIGSGPLSAYDTYRAAVNEIAAEDTEALRQTELIKLDSLEAAVHEMINKPVPLVRAGQIVTVDVCDEDGIPITDADGSPIAKQVGDPAVTLQAVDRAIKLMDRRAKLLGLDRPTKYVHTDLSGDDAVPEIVSGTDLDRAASLYAQSLGSRG